MNTNYGEKQKHEYLVYAHDKKKTMERTKIHGKRGKVLKVSSPRVVDLRF